jgi:hypothetical protein
VTPAERRKLFDIRKRSKEGRSVTKAEHRFAEKMFRLYPDEYALDEKRVFLETAPLGANKEFLGKVWDATSEARAAIGEGSHASNNITKAHHAVKELLAREKEDHAE